MTPLGTRKSYKPRREWEVLDSVGRREAQINELKAPVERLLVDERIQKEKDEVKRKIKSRKKKRGKAAVTAERASAEIPPPTYFRPDPSSR